MADIFLSDARVNCLSGMGQIGAAEYLSMVEAVYRESGGIEGQRAPLKTKTGINIRKRMVEDIKNGALLPPIVLGAVVGDEIFEAASKVESNEAFVHLLRSIDKSRLSIIDGMQRTTALDAAMRDSNIDGTNIRVDLWLAKSLDSLVYRMLVLNTGQVPWDIKRQLETIYKQVLLEIEKGATEITVFEIDSKERRSGAGQYRSARIVELFLAFTSRKPHIELKEKVAEDFARMDATEATANQDTLPVFIETMKLLARFDQVLSKTTCSEDLVTDSTRFKEGRDIFTSAPASIGFAAAAAQYLLGKPGYAFTFSEMRLKLERLTSAVQIVIDKVSSEFVDYATLNEKISARSGRIGEYEREFFFRAFELMFNDAAQLQSLTPCWSAYK
ncbi:hypothetical protein [Rhodoferax sp. TH121]|uniref:hypothetical protein n=1 Tax=Rhodoferax sp. TH121 TaxID=2022803 RepID=UPI000B976F11|nr:hypothetical protein [Rhodoferax sp. TH121]